MSRDGGRSWKTAKEAGLSESWGAWAGGSIRCNVRVPEDGAYDFYAQLGDAVSNRQPEPKAGEPADPRLRIVVKAPLKAAHLACRNSTCGASGPSRTNCASRASATP